MFLFVDTRVRRAVALQNNSSVARAAPLSARTAGCAQSTMGREAQRWRTTEKKMAATGLDGPALYLLLRDG